MHFKSFHKQGDNVYLQLIKTKKKLIRMQQQTSKYRFELPGLE